MLEEALEQLAVKRNGIYLDCTFGRGGHSREILRRLGEDGKLLAVDRDVEAVQSETAQDLGKDARFELFHGCFSELSAIVERAGLSGQIDGILLDLGVSSPQLDNPERGFSFMKDGPLDMRMNSNAGRTAAEWLATVSEQDLVKVLFEYGEERYARRIARAIVASRTEAPIETTRQLAELVAQASPSKERHKHPATRVFQAIRIEVNRELDELQAALRQALQVLKPGGRLVVISFHSLEDRIVKRFIRSESGAKHDPGRLPVMEADIARGALKKIGHALKAGQHEIEQNPRARSAVMRVAERV
ncbi:MAG: 16S rRNA (cytosine(1402)-N(4))-methyltransferase RsmH [Gammaproteobacteria bacterium]